jgi:Fe-S oxidoreductase
MCPSYMATREEKHSTRGRANVLRLAMSGRLGEAGLGDEGVYEVLDLCLECRACKIECPLGVDVARFKSEFLADYYKRHGTPLSARLVGNARAAAEWGSRLAPMANWMMRAGVVRRLMESMADVDRRRHLPEYQRETLVRRVSRARAGDGGRVLPASPEASAGRRSLGVGGWTRRPLADCDVVLFNDTFTNYYDPQIGLAALDVLEAAGARAGLAQHGCCGRPQISKGLLSQARAMAERTTRELHAHAAAGRRILFCEPSCLSAIREDVPALVRGELRGEAQAVSRASLLFEEYVESIGDRLQLKPGPRRILFHGHCHQKSMGLAAPAKALLSRIPAATVVDLDAGCCGMAGSFGYTRGHVEVSQAIGERKLFPAVRARDEHTAVVAAGTSCRHQVLEFTGASALHPAVLLQTLLAGRAG